MEEDPDEYLYMGKTGDGFGDSGTTIPSALDDSDDDILVWIHQRLQDEKAEIAEDGLMSSLLGTSTKIDHRTLPR